jgi:hypothetical protein
VGKKEKGKTEPKGKARGQWSQQQAGSHTIATPQQGRQRRRRRRPVVGLVGWKKREAILGYRTGTGNF